MNVAQFLKAQRIEIDAVDKFFEECIKGKMKRKHHGREVYATEPEEQINTNLND